MGGSGGKVPSAEELRQAAKATGAFNKAMSTVTRGITQMQEGLTPAKTTTVNLPTWPQVDKAYAQHVQGRVVPTLKSLGIGALAGGSAMAGLMHLLRMKQEQKDRKAVRREQVPAVRVYRAKRANDGWVDMVSDKLVNAAKSTFRGDQARSVWQLPLFTPVAGAVGAGGLAAGYKGTDMLLSSIRNRLRKRELESARREYEQALAAASGSKLAEDRCQLARDMDRLMDAIEIDGQIKLAAPGSLSRGAGAGLGLYLLAALGLSGYAAHQGVKAERKNSLGNAIRRAYLERQVVDPRRAVPNTAEVIDVEPAGQSEDKRSFPRIAA